MPMVYGIVAVAIAGGIVAGMRSGAHVKLAGATVTAPKSAPAKPGKAKSGKRKAKGKVADEDRILSVDDGDEYIKQFRMCVAGVEVACNRVGKSYDPKRKFDKPTPRGEDGEEGGAPVEVAAQYSDPSSKEKGDEELFDPATVELALDSAKRRTACKHAVGQPGCSDSPAKQAETSRQLAALSGRAKKACQKRQHNACLIRGELELALGQRENAILWLDKAKMHAGNVRSRCENRTEKSLDRCRGADETFASATAKLDEAKKLSH